MSIIKTDESTPRRKASVPEVEKYVEAPRDARNKIREAKFVKAVLEGEKGPMNRKVQQIFKEDGHIISRATAAVRAVELRKTPGVMEVLDAAATNAEESIVEIADYAKKLGKTGGKEGASYASVALSANKEILDRVHGRAKQQIDVQSKSLTIRIDLSSALQEGEDE